MSRKPRVLPGRSADRLKIERNNLERALVAQWKKEHRHGDLTAMLLFGNEDTMNRDRIVSATIIQWLGSDVGMAFLREALGREGLEIKPR